MIVRLYFFAVGKLPNDWSLIHTPSMDREIFLESHQAKKERMPTFMPGKTCASTTARGGISSTGLGAQRQCHRLGTHCSYQQDDDPAHWYALDGSEDVVYLDSTRSRHRV
jgi:hypothetical protein